MPIPESYAQAETLMAGWVLYANRAGLQVGANAHFSSSVRVFCAYEAFSKRDCSNIGIQYRLFIMHAGKPQFRERKRSNFVFPKL